MELLIAGVLAFIALMAFAPDEAVKIGLVAAWGLGAVAVLVAIVRWLAG